MITALCDATILTGEAMVEGHALLVRDGKVLDIVGNRKIPAEAQKTSHGDTILASGLIDAQVNGGGNVLFNNAPTAEGCIAIAKAHRKFGTTRLLPTCISDTPHVMDVAITAMREARKSCQEILGIHVEGPHLSADARGVHKAEHIRALNAQDMRLFRREGDEIMLLTVAPENATPQQITGLHNQGVIVSLGHTSATAKQIHAALDAGATGFTHLYNGMGGMSARAPGPSGIALDDRDSWCGLIADGHHVSPEMIRLAARAKPQGKIYLVSDAMAPAASVPQPFELYGETIHVEDGRCVNKEGKLAGTAITLFDAVRYCAMKCGIELDEALRMASTYPAAFLGLGKKLGKLLPGFEADIVALSHKLELKAVWMSGQQS